MNPYFNMLIGISTNHLPTHLHIAIRVSQLSKRLDNFNFFRPPNFRLRYDGLNMNFIRIYMIDTFMVLMIEKYPTYVYISFFHTILKRFDFHRMLDVYYVFMGVL